MSPRYNDFIGAIAVVLAAGRAPGAASPETNWAIKPSFLDSSPADADILITEHARVYGARQLDTTEPNGETGLTLFQNEVLQRTAEHKSVHGSHHLLGLLAVYKSGDNDSSAALWVPRTFQQAVSATAQALEAEARPTWLTRLPPQVRMMNEYIHAHSENLQPLIDATITGIVLAGLPDSSGLSNAITWRESEDGLSAVATGLVDTAKVSF